MSGPVNLDEFAQVPYEWAAESPLEHARANRAGQAVDWLSEAEARGHGIPDWLALEDAAEHNTWGPWTTQLENENAEIERSCREAWEDHNREGYRWYLEENGLFDEAFEAEERERGRYSDHDSEYVYTDGDGS